MLLSILEAKDYIFHLLILVCLYLILAQSFNLAFGLGRLLNLAHIATYAIGAYTTALLSTGAHAEWYQATEYGTTHCAAVPESWLCSPLSVWSCMPLSMVVSAFFALLIGAISRKLSDDYFAIGTLAFSAVVNALLVNWKSVTRGVLGIPGIPRPEFFGIDFYENGNFLAFIGVIVLLFEIWIYLIFRSRLARSLRAQGENELAALSLAKDTKRIRNDVFILSSLFGGLAGSLFAYYLNYIDPSSFWSFRDGLCALDCDYRPARILLGG